MVAVRAMTLDQGHLSAICLHELAAQLGSVLTGTM
jgi:hypothetical protein